MDDAFFSVPEVCTGVPFEVCKSQLLIVGAGRRQGAGRREQEAAPPMGFIAPSQAAELPSHKSRLTRDTDHLD